MKKVQAFFFIYSVLQTKKKKRKKDRSIPADLKKNCLLCEQYGIEHMQSFKPCTSLLLPGNILAQAAAGMASLC